MIEVDLTKLQEEEMKILSICKEILDRHDLPFFLNAGSCLGAVRHHGIIPWDDDIDIALFRADYIKAGEVLKQELPEGYSYCDYLSEPDYPYNFAKVRKDKSAMVHGGDAHLKINQGIYIDIFPLDACSSDLNEYRKQYKRVQFFKTCIDLAYMNYKKHGKRRPIYQIPIIGLAHLIINKKYAHLILDKEIMKYSRYLREKGKQQFITNYFGIYGEKERCSLSCYGEGMIVPFGALMCRIPEDYDLLLTQIYGDYMTPPPLEKRVSHHDLVYFSLTSSYSGEHITQ